MDHSFYNTYNIVTIVGLRYDCCFYRHHYDTYRFSLFIFWSRAQSFKHKHCCVTEPVIMTVNGKTINSYAHITGIVTKLANTLQGRAKIDVPDYCLLTCIHATSYKSFSNITASSLFKVASLFVVLTLVQPPSAQSQWTCIPATNDATW